MSLNKNMQEKIEKFCLQHFKGNQKELICDMNYLVDCLEEEIKEACAGKSFLYFFTINKANKDSIKLEIGNYLFQILPEYISSKTSLIHIRMNNVEFTDKSFGLFAEMLKNCPNVSKIDLSKSKLSEVGAFKENFKKIVQNKKIKMLQLDKCDLTLGQFQWIAKIIEEGEKNNNIDISGIDLSSNREIRGIVKELKSEKLTMIKLDSCELYDVKDIESILDNNLQLQHLYLSDNQFASVDIASLLVKIDKHLDLKTLTIRSNQQDLSDLSKNVQKSFYEVYKDRNQNIECSDFSREVKISDTMGSLDANQDYGEIVMKIKKEVVNSATYNPKNSPFLQEKNKKLLDNQADESKNNNASLYFPEVSFSIQEKTQILDDNNTNSQIKSTKDSGADKFFKSQSEQVYENVPDLRPDQKKNEGSFKSGNWYNQTVIENDTEYYNKKRKLATSYIVQKSEKAEQENSNNSKNETLEILPSAFLTNMESKSAIDAEQSKKQ